MTIHTFYAPRQRGKTLWLTAAMVQELTERRDKPIILISTHGNAGFKLIAEAACTITNVSLSRIKQCQPNSLPINQMMTGLRGASVFVDESDKLTTKALIALLNCERSGHIGTLYLNGSDE